MNDDHPVVRVGEVYAYGIVKQSGGYIFADSEPGKGTSFSVYLPVHIASAQEKEPASIKSTPSARSDWATGTIVLEGTGGIAGLAGAPRLASLDSDLAAPTSPAGYFDTARSPLNPANHDKEVVYGTAPIFAVPSVDALWIARDHAPDALRALAADVAQAFADADAPLSPALYALGEHDQLVPFQPAVDHPAAAAIRLGHLRLAERAYADQRAALADADERYVASYGIYGDPDGGVVAITTWTRGVATLLPVADVVNLVVLDGDRAERVVSVPLAALAAPDDGAFWMFPADVAGPDRFATAQFPDDDELDALAAAHPDAVASARWPSARGPS